MADLSGKSVLVTGGSRGIGAAMARAIGAAGGEVIIHYVRHRDAAEALRRTSLHAEHVLLGARMVPFAGWEMPVQYSGIIEEHQAVRQAAGMFDVSHMGRFELIGPEAAALLRYVCTYDMTRLSPGRGHYAAACRPDGIAPGEIPEPHQHGRGAGPPGSQTDFRLRLGHDLVSK